MSQLDLLTPVDYPIERNEEEKLLTEIERYISANPMNGKLLNLLGKTAKYLERRIDLAKKIIYK